ncbi:MAG: PHP domain-containing protein [Firmicutes bacterium]|nr:PHP domain-containing protein [Bacillota bacterium]
MMKLFADYHTHTRYSHGTGTVEDNVLAARARGLKQVAISDHGPASLFGVGVRNLATFGKIREEVRECNARYPEIGVLTGVEANVIGADGALDVPGPVLEELDIVLAGLHVTVMPASLADGFKLGLLNALRSLDSRLGKLARDLNTKALVEAVYRYPIDIVTHPGLRLSIDTRELARACAQNGTAMEINTGHGQTTVEFIQVAAAEGVDFAIGSDAHQPSRVGDLEAGLELALRAGLSPDRIINAVHAEDDLPGQLWRNLPHSPGRKPVPRRRNILRI